MFVLTAILEDTTTVRTGEIVTITGEVRASWDKNDPVSVAAAEAVFAVLAASTLLAEPVTDTHEPVQVKQFNPEAATILTIPRLAGG